MDKFNIIIHISGASGSGKSYLGKRVLGLYGNKIIVKDIDELRFDFLEYYGETKKDVTEDVAYQEYINSYIDNIEKQNVPIIFVGINNHQCSSTPDLYYDFHTDYKFYIDIDDNQLVKQNCVRCLTNIINDEIAMNDLVNDNEKFINVTHEIIKNHCNAKKIIENSKRWKNDYEKQGYIRANSDEIYNQVVSILNNIMKGETRK